MRMLVWFRRDLRVNDNIALDEAARASSSGVIAVYCISPKQWKEHDEADCKVGFWMENLRALQRQLEQLNIPLRLLTMDGFAEAPEAMLKLARQFDCQCLYFNREYEVNEARRDADVTERLEGEGIEVRSFDDRVLLPPDAVLSQQGKPYSVFTPFKKQWISQAEAIEFKERPTPSKQPKIDVQSSEIPASISGFDLSLLRSDLWPAGEDAAQERLSKFAENRIRDYNDHRDLPAVNGTSLLSPYLAAGVLSVRQCLHRAMEANRGSLERKGWGASTWISELIWREFYTQVMVHFPRVSMHQPFQKDTNRLEWRDDEEQLQAWQSGKTGYPIVDAAMRQLNQTGWMHNRLRMVAAMFLSKHLLIDWRKGERYFMQRLIDGDLAANNGGWQWSASTGTDAVPYFRIFNPYSQSQRFDEEGAFIKRLCPELDSVPASALHDPKKLDGYRSDAEYPEPIVGHKEGRERALAAFKSLKD